MFTFVKMTFVMLITVIVITSCSENSSNPINKHVAGANCGSCHNTEQSQWSSSSNFHALSASDVLTNAEHNHSEILKDNCLKCHSIFQYPLGISHFVTPVDTIGSPAGQWKALNISDWQATKCEVCHDPTNTDTLKLAKYGAMLDGQFAPNYVSITSMPVAYQKILNLSTGAFSTFTYPDQNGLNVKITKLCNSCHDPADQGSDSAVIVNGINYGPQGGDSRVYVASNHQGLGCADCHNVHTFTPVDPQTKSVCKGCHSVPQNGKVHINHV